MKVLYLNSGNLFGGIETLLLTIAGCRGKCPEMEPEFAVCFEGKFSAALSGAGVPVHILGAARMSRPWQVWSARRALGKVLRERRPDVVVAHGSWSMALLGPAVRKAKIPLVYWTHDRVTLPLPAQEKWASLTPPDFIVANSRYSAEGQKGLYDGVPLQVIYCALNPPERRYSEQERLQFRTANDTPAEVPVILQVSRLDPHKGHRTHLAALGKMRELPWICWFVAAPQRPAEEEYIASLKQQATELGIMDRIRFLGWQKDIGLVMESADIFCQPNSGPEPFGLTYVEALWRGKPVVTTAMAGALEVLTPECGILTAPGDITDLQAALTSLIENQAKRKRLGDTGPARAWRLCDPAERLKEIHACLQKVVGRA